MLCTSICIYHLSLHGFPDNFVFSGGKSAIYKQIGNAVPPTLAETIAFVVRDILSGKEIKESDSSNLFEWHKGSLLNQVA